VNRLRLSATVPRCRHAHAWLDTGCLPNASLGGTAQSSQFLCVFHRLTNAPAWLNDDVIQDWNTNDMIFDVPALIEFLSGSTPLLPGTVILTGTPHGVGMAQKPPRWLKAVDRVTVEIEKIGSLTNPVVNEP
jgi:2-keto-4-pentenoate hydratase/2-oxohepta-3-ene-1,7-dioic acid hydratase in catechol pathway